MSKYLYLSSNREWGGSEELWTRVASLQSSRGDDVIYYAPMDVQNSVGKARRLNAPISDGLLGRLMVRAKLRDLENEWVTLLKKEKPDLAIISQGSLFGGLQYMEHCQKAGIPFVTIVQLVAEVHFLALNSDNITRLQRSYLNAEKNYFVSEANKDLAEWMLGISLPNSEIAFNPCKVRASDILSWPGEQPHLNIAMVGRLESFHKGHDIALRIFTSEEWRQRPVRLRIYGYGPHEKSIRDNIERHRLSNVSIEGPSKDIRGLWQENHLLLMPSRMEGQALSLIEAMWCGRPAVATDVGGVSTLIDDGVNGYVAKTAAVSDVADALERAWQARHNWSNVGKAAAEVIRRVHPEDEIEHFHRQLSSVLKKV